MKGNKAQKASLSFANALDNSDYMLLTLKKEMMPNSTHKFNIYRGIHTMVYLSVSNCVFSSIVINVVDYLHTECKLLCFLLCVKSTATGCRCVKPPPIYHLLESRALRWEATYQWNIIAKMVRTHTRWKIK